MPLDPPAADQEPSTEPTTEPTVGPSTDPTVTRRQVLGGLAAGATGLLLGGTGISPASASTDRPSVSAGKLPDPTKSGIEHVVVLMMENRSFDHFLGWLPGSEGRQAGFKYPDPSGKLHATYHLTTYQGCAYNDPDHSYKGGRIELNKGGCDGWLLDTANDILCIGYYEQTDLPFFGHAARYWTTCDHYFAATMGPTYPNRFYMHSAQTDRTTDTFTTSTLPTIWDSLEAAGVSHTYYYSDIPFTALWGDKYASITEPISKFLAHCKSGKLPAVSYVDPRFEDEGDGTSGDDHPFGDIRVGEYFLNQVYEAITASSDWARTVFVINFDEWGGFFDHVVPSKAPDVKPSNGLRGFRVPALVISPRSRRKHVAHHVYDHTSVLKMIEWRWGLEPLTVRDAAARNIAEVLDFSSPPDLTAPQWSVPNVTPTPCSNSTSSAAPVGDPTEHELTWSALADKARAAGFPRP